MNYESGIAAIDGILDSLPTALQDQEKTVLRKVGNVIKKNVKSVMVKSDVEQRAKKKMPSNYDKSKPYIHMKNDVKTSVRKDKNGNLYVSVRGGKKTGYKWHMVSDGHLARDGSTFVPGNNFMAKAVRASERDVNKLIDEMLRKVTEE